MGIHLTREKNVSALALWLQLIFRTFIVDFQIVGGKISLFDRLLLHVRSQTLDLKDLVEMFNA